MSFREQDRQSLRHCIAKVVFNHFGYGPGEDMAFLCDREGATIIAEEAIQMFYEQHAELSSEQSSK